MSAAFRYVLADAAGRVATRHKTARAAQRRLHELRRFAGGDGAAKYANIPIVDLAVVDRRFAPASIVDHDLVSQLRADLAVARKELVALRKLELRIRDIIAEARAMGINEEGEFAAYLRFIDESRATAEAKEE